MGARSDQVKGRTKEAIGDLTGNEDLKSEGTADRRSGETKEKLGRATEKIEEVIDKGKSALNRE